MKQMFNQLPVKVDPIIEAACENIDLAARLQDEAQTILEEVVSTLVSGFASDKTKSQQLQNAFQAMNRLTRSTELLGTAQLQIRPYFVAKMPNSCEGCKGAD